MTYTERYKDINVQRLVKVKDPDGKTVQFEAYGEQLDGTTTWILLHIAPTCEHVTASTE